MYERKIVGFHQDDQSNWVADLECGHTQHVRHNPPWMNRLWVMTDEVSAVLDRLEKAPAAGELRCRGWTRRCCGWPR